MDKYSSTSNLRRLNVVIYPAIGKVDFLRRVDVDSTSKSICADVVYFSTSIQQFNVEIPLSIKLVDSSTSNIRGSYVEVSLRYGDLEVSDVSLFALLSALKHWCKFENKGEWIYQVN